MISRLKVEPSCCCNITSQRKKKARNALCKLARIDKDTRPLRAAAAAAAAAMRSTGCHASEFANSRPTWIKLTYDEVILSHCHGSGFIRHPLSRMMPKSGPPACLWWCPRPPWWHLILPKKSSVARRRRVCGGSSSSSSGLGGRCSCKRWCPPHDSSHYFQLTFLGISNSSSPFLLLSVDRGADVGDGDGGGGGVSAAHNVRSLRGRRTMTMTRRT